MYKESEGSDSTGEASYIPAPQPRHTDPEVQTCSLHDHKSPLNRLCFNKIKSTTNINKAPLNQLCLNKIKNTTNIDEAPVKYSLPKKKKKKIPIVVLITPTDLGKFCLNPGHPFTQCC